MGVPLAFQVEYSSLCRRTTVFPLALSDIPAPPHKMPAVLSGQQWSSKHSQTFPKVPQAAKVQYPVGDHWSRVPTINRKRITVESTKPPLCGVTGRESSSSLIVCFNFTSSSFSLFLRGSHTVNDSLKLPQRKAFRSICHSENIPTGMCKEPTSLILLVDLSLAS